MPIPGHERGKKRRAALQAAGLRVVQIWVPDTRQPGFDAQCHRQSLATAAADRADGDLDGVLDIALIDLDSIDPA